MDGWFYPIFIEKYFYESHAILNIIFAIHPQKKIKEEK